MKKFIVNEVKSKKVRREKIVRRPVVIDHIIRKPIVFEDEVVRVPVVLEETMRSPVIRNDLAVKIIQGKATDDEKGTFHSIVHNMICSLVRREENSGCFDETFDFEECVSACHHAVEEALKFYDVKRGGVVTWLWHVINNFLKTRRMRMLRDKRTQIRTENTDNNQTGVLYRRARTNVTLHIDLKDTVKGLIKKYPAMKLFLIEMLGDPTQREYVPPCKCNLKEANRKIKGDYMKLWSFWTHTVLPVLSELQSH